LHYLWCPSAAHFIKYSNNDHTGDIDTIKNTSGTFFLGKCLISWQSVKQQVVACPVARWSTSLPQTHRLKLSGWLSCWVISLAEMQWHMLSYPNQHLL
jgi:hypothetical protein